ncbi:MAG: hypothetical protein Q8R01_18195 [Ramlibacter sp.]|nr:hypothetical protein [Ramlibacter sp.]
MQFVLPFAQPVLSKLFHTRELFVFGKLLLFTVIRFFSPEGGRLEEGQKYHDTIGITATIMMEVAGITFKSDDGSIMILLS